MKSTDKLAKSNHFIIYLYAIVTKTVVLEKNNLFLIKEIQSSLKNLFKRFKRRNTTSQWKNPDDCCCLKKSHDKKLKYEKSQLFNWWKC